MNCQALCTISVGMQQKMQTFFIAIALIFLTNYCDGFIAPLEVHRWQENLFVIPSFLKGLDSRIGFGFRLGNHADFQSIFDIGPQKITKPLEKRAEEVYSSTNKRMADQNYHVRVAKLPPLKSNSTRYYTSKRSFSTKNQYPLPKSLKNVKSFRSIAVQKYSSTFYRQSSKTSPKPMTFLMRKNPVKLKKTQRIKNVSLAD